MLSGPLRRTRANQRSPSPWPSPGGRGDTLLDKAPSLKLRSPWPAVPHVGSASDFAKATPDASPAPTAEGARATCQSPLRSGEYEIRPYGYALTLALSRGERGNGRDAIPPYAPGRASLPAAGGPCPYSRRGTGDLPVAPTVETPVLDTPEAHTRATYQSPLQSKHWCQTPTKLRATCQSPLQSKHRCQTPTKLRATCQSPLQSEKSVSDAYATPS